MGAVSELPPWPEYGSHDASALIAALRARLAKAVLMLEYAPPHGGYPYDLGEVIAACKEPSP